MQGSHVVEENEWADHPSLGERQHAAHFEATEVATALINQQLGHGGVLGGGSIWLHILPRADRRDHSPARSASIGQRLRS
jgi:hypothetical protein